MQKLYQINHFVEKHFPWFVLCSVCLGGGFRELASVILPPLPVLVTLLMLHVIMPLLVLGLGNLLFPDAPLFTIGLVLEFSILTAVASLMWVGMSGGNTPCVSLSSCWTPFSPPRSSP